MHVSLMNYLIPVMALAAGTLILSEVLVGTVVIGLMFILSRTVKVRLLFVPSP